MTIALPQYIGNSRPIGNVGDMRNQGVEFDLKYDSDSINLSSMWVLMLHILKTH